MSFVSFIWFSALTFPIMTLCSCAFPFIFSWRITRLQKRLWLCQIGFLLLFPSLLYYWHRLHLIGFKKTASCPQLLCPSTLLLWDLTCWFREVSFLEFSCCCSSPSLVPTSISPPSWSPSGININHYITGANDTLYLCCIFLWSFFQGSTALSIAHGTEQPL